jgi:hypothetical protein
MSIYQVKGIEFLTQMPDNEFKGDPITNARLQKEWLGETIQCNYEPESHLGEVLNFIEDTCGMLVGHVTLECVGKRDHETPTSFTENMPSLRGFYPAGWVWARKATLIN